MNEKSGGRETTNQELNERNGSVRKPEETGERSSGEGREETTYTQQAQVKKRM